MRAASLECSSCSSDAVSDLVHGGRSLVADLCIALEHIALLEGLMPAMRLDWLLLSAAASSIAFGGSTFMHQGMMAYPLCPGAEVVLELDCLLLHACLL